MDNSSYVKYICFLCSQEININLKYLQKGYLMLYESLKFHQNSLVRFEVIGHYSTLCKFWGCLDTSNYPASSLYLKLLILVAHFHIEITSIYYSETDYEP